MPESGEEIPYKSMQFWIHVYYCNAVYFSKSLKISIQQLKSKEVQKWERYHTHTHTKLHGHLQQHSYCYS